MLIAKTTRACKELPLPSYETPGSSGMDLRADMKDTGAEESLTIPPKGRALVSTGLILRLENGTEGQIRSRSGLALKHGIAVLNSPGTIDQDYRGTLKVILQNHGDKPFKVNHGDRIAQLIISSVIKARLTLVEQEVLGDTERSSGGFGSTGTE